MKNVHMKENRREQQADMKAQDISFVLSSRFLYQHIFAENETLETV